MAIEKTRFFEEFLKGQQGLNKGIPLGPGLQNLSNAINGIQKGKMITVASAPKVGRVLYDRKYKRYFAVLSSNI